MKLKIAKKRRAPDVVLDGPVTVKIGDFVVEISPEDGIGVSPELSSHELKIVLKSHRRIYSRQHCGMTYIGGEGAAERKKSDG